MSSPPPSPFPNVEGTNPSDWNNLSVTPQGVRKKSKKSKKKEADAGDKDTSPSRFKTNTMKPELKPIKAKGSSKLPPLLKNKHAKVGLSESPEEDAVEPSSDPLPTDTAPKKVGGGNIVTNAFMDAAAARYRRDPNDAKDLDKTVEEQLGMKDINGTVLDEDIEVAYTTNRFMPAKKPKRSEDYFDGAASYVTDEDARLGRHFHRRKKMDKYGWWEADGTNQAHQARLKENLGEVATKTATTTTTTTTTCSPFAARCTLVRR